MPRLIVLNENANGKTHTSNFLFDHVESITKYHPGRFSLPDDSEFNKKNFTKDELAEVDDICKANSKPVKVEGSNELNDGDQVIRELAKNTIPQLQKILDRMKIEYPTSATKPVLIDLVKKGQEG
jgi:hypothetical protein